MQKWLKGKYSFCNQIYTLQQYSNDRRTRKSNKKSKKKYFRKKYYLRKSLARKPYLNKDRYVRKFDKCRTYKNKLECFTCGQPNHLVRDCLRKNNLYNKQIALVECVNENILNVDEYIC